MGTNCYSGSEAAYLLQIAQRSGSHDCSPQFYLLEGFLLSCRCCLALAWASHKSKAVCAAWRYHLEDNRHGLGSKTGVILAGQQASSLHHSRHGLGNTAGMNLATQWAWSWQHSGYGLGNTTGATLDGEVQGNGVILRNFSLHCLVWGEAQSVCQL